MRRLFRTAPRVARYTWSRQWPAFLLEGCAVGLIGLSTFAVKRSLGGRDDVVPWLIVLWQVGWILSPAVGPLLARGDPQRTWRRIGLVAGVPLLLCALVSVEPTGKAGHGTGNLALFMGLTFLHYLSMIAHIPHRGALIRTNYPPDVRGRFFGLLGGVFVVGAAISAKIGGHLLDRDPRWLRVLFPAAGVFQLVGIFQHSRIRWRSRRHLRAFAAHGQSPVRAMRSAWRDALDILKKDRAFRIYELSFMLYGIAFLCGIGLLALFAEGELRLSYAEYTWAQSIAFPVAQIVGSVLLGRYAHKAGVVKITAFAFLLLALFYAGMGFVDSYRAFVLLYLLFGFAMAGVHYGWTLGPLHFAPEGRAHMYAAIHFSMVGIRSIFAPHLGLWARDAMSYSAAFGLSVALFLCGLVTLWKLRNAKGG